MGQTIFPVPASGKNYSYVKYTSTQTITLPSTLDGYVDVIIVGGGGSGAKLSDGNNNGSTTCGGAGGETVIAPRMPIAAGGSLTLTVGAGAATKTTSGNGVTGSLSRVALTGAWSLTSNGGVGGQDNLGNSSTGTSANTLTFTTSGVSNGSGYGWGVGGAMSFFQSCKEDFPSGNVSGASAGDVNNLSIIPAQYRTNATAGSAGGNATASSASGIGGTASAGSWWSGKGGQGPTSGGNGTSGTGGGGGGGGSNGSTAATAGAGGAGGANTGGGGGGGGGGSSASTVSGNGGAGGSGFIILGYWSQEIQWHTLHKQMKTIVYYKQSQFLMMRLTMLLEQNKNHLEFLSLRMFLVKRLIGFRLHTTAQCVEDSATLEIYMTQLMICLQMTMNINMQLKQQELLVYRTR